jgi:hypothetical protein
MYTYINAGQSTLELRVTMLNVEKSLQEVYSFRNKELEKYHEKNHEKHISNENFVINGVDKR